LFLSDSLLLRSQACRSMLQTIPIVARLGRTLARGQGRLTAAWGKVHRSEIIFMLTRLLCSFLNPLLTVRDAVVSSVHECVVMVAAAAGVTRRLLILYIGSFRLLGDELR
jgi:hypothetical protein